MLAADKGFVFSRPRRRRQAAGPALLCRHEAEGVPAFENAVTLQSARPGEAATAVLGRRSSSDSRRDGGAPGVSQEEVQRRAERTQESPGRQPGESSAGWPRSPKGARAEPPDAGSRWMARHPFRACEPSCPWQSPGLHLGSHHALLRSSGICAWDCGVPGTTTPISRRVATL